VCAAVIGVVEIKESGTRKNWKYRIVDAKLIPPMFMIPAMVNEVLIGKTVKSASGNIEIPGVEIYSEDILAGAK